MACRTFNGVTNYLYTEVRLVALLSACIRSPRVVGCLHPHIPSPHVGRPQLPRRCHCGRRRGTRDHHRDQPPEARGGGERAPPQARRSPACVALHCKERGENPSSLRRLTLLTFRASFPTSQPYASHAAAGAAGPAPCPRRQKAGQSAYATLRGGHGRRQRAAPP